MHILHLKFTSAANLQNLWRNMIYCGSSSVLLRVGGAYWYVLRLAPSLLLVLLKLHLLMLLLLPLLLLLSLKTLFPVQQLASVRSRGGNHLFESWRPEILNQNLTRDYELFYFSARSCYKMIASSPKGMQISLAFLYNVAGPRR